MKPGVITRESLVTAIRETMPTLLESEILEWADKLLPVFQQAEQELDERWDYENDRYKV